MLEKNTYQSPVTHYSPPVYAEQDDIDLFKLFLLLWRKKVQIIMSAVVGLMLAGLYVFTAPEVWTAQTYINPPKLIDFEDYLDYQRHFLRLGIIESEPETLAEKVSTKLFEDFIKLALSPDKKMTFLMTTDYFAQETKKMSAADKRRWLSRHQQESLRVIPPDENSHISYYTIMMKATSAKAAHQLLNGYINQVNNAVIAQESSEFRNKVISQIQTINQKINDIEFNTHHKKQAQLATLQQALTTAQKAGIKEYHKTNTIGKTENELYPSFKLFMLGERFLLAEIENVKHSNAILPAKYYDMRRQLQQANPLLENKIHLQAYHYELEPTEPVTKDEPKTVLILILGVFLGMIFGIMGAIMSHTITHYRQRMKAV